MVGHAQQAAVRGPVDGVQPGVAQLEAKGIGEPGVELGLHTRRAGLGDVDVARGDVGDLVAHQQAVGGDGGGDPVVRPAQFQVIALGALGPQRDGGGEAEVADHLADGRRLEAGAGRGDGGEARAKRHRSGEAPRRPGSIGLRVVVSGAGGERQPVHRQATDCKGGGVRKIAALAR